MQVKGENTDVNVKRLANKPAPKRFGRKLTVAQKALATHICVDCGWIYADKCVALGNRIIHTFRVIVSQA